MVEEKQRMDDSLECNLGRLLERSQIMEKQLGEIKEYMRSVDQRIAVEIKDYMKKVDERLDALETARERFTGGQTVATWVGSALLFVLGALGSLAISWLNSPKGPLGH